MGDSCCRSSLEVFVKQGARPAYEATSKVTPQRILHARRRLTIYVALLRVRAGQGRADFWSGFDFSVQQRKKCRARVIIEWERHDMTKRLCSIFAVIVGLLFATSAEAQRAYEGQIIGSSPMGRGNNI